MNATPKPRIDQLPPELREAVLQMSRDIREAGGRMVLVGGWVRDALLGHPSKDADVEVFGLMPERLEPLLLRQGSVHPVGRSFGVFRIKGLELDVALPRRERKSGPGHQDFAIGSDPGMSFPEAAARRDFTVNAISWDPLEDRLIDPTGGVEDLRRGRLRHVGPPFAEDPLRVLRAMQFIARFDLEPAPETIGLCRRIAFEGLSSERVFEEWRKLILRGHAMRAGLDFLRSCFWLRYFPELEALDGCPQDPQWHPEGDVLTHTAHCLEAFARERSGDPGEDLATGLAVLCHDFGKPATTRFSDGRWRSPRHDAEGVEPARRFLERMTRESALIEAVLPLVAEHMRPLELYRSGAGDPAIRRLAGRVGRIDRLVRVARADRQGRPPEPPGAFAETEWLLERARLLEVERGAPEPLVLGRHLIERGLQPGPGFKPILDACYEAQLNGVFTDRAGAMTYLDQYLKG